MNLAKDGFLQKIKYFFLFLALLVGTAVIVSGHGSLPRADEIAYTNHLVDYSFGFCTKFLSGALYHLFFDRVLLRQVELFETALLFAVFCAVAAILAHAVSTAHPDKRGSLLFFSVFFLTGPATFSIYSRELGMIDVLWLPVCAAALLCAQNQFLCWLVPPLCGVCVLVHPSACVSYLLFIGLVLLWLITEKKHALRTGLVLLLSVCVAGGLVLYFAKNETRNLTYPTAEAFNQALEARAVDGDVYTVYYDFVFYGKTYTDTHGDVSREPAAAQDGQGVRSLAKTIRDLVVVTVGYHRADPENLLQLPLLLAILSPLLVYGTRFWLCLFRRSRGDRLRRLTAALCIAQFYVTLIGGCLESTDVVRWTAHAFLIQCALLLFVLSRVSLTQEELRKVFPLPVPHWCTGLYFALYASLVLYPYS